MVCGENEKTQIDEKSLIEKNFLFNFDVESDAVLLSYLRYTNYT